MITYFKDATDNLIIINFADVVRVGAPAAPVKDYHIDATTKHGTTFRFIMADLVKAECVFDCIISWLGRPDRVLNLKESNFAAMLKDVQII